jgi:hypothetical protein
MNQVTSVLTIFEQVIVLGWISMSSWSSEPGQRAQSIREYANLRRISRAFYEFVPGVPSLVPSATRAEIIWVWLL